MQYAIDCLILLSMYFVIKYLDILYVHVVEFYTRHIKVFLLILGNANIKQAYHLSYWPFYKEINEYTSENIKGYFQLDKI